MRTETTLVGRAAELARIEGALNGVQEEGQYRVLAISGEPGIGKTRLLSELAVIGARRGCTVLSGRGTELERDAPFAALVEALDGFLGSLSPVQLEGLGDRLPHLGGVFPAIGSRVEVRPGPAEERYRHHRAIGAMLEELAAARPPPDPTRPASRRAADAHRPAILRATVRYRFR